MPPEHHQREHHTMNRQIIPSMILSVLIVCFFSVLLHDRDKPRSGLKREPEPASSPDWASQAAGTAVNSPPAADPRPAEKEPARPQLQPHVPVQSAPVPPPVRPEQPARRDPLPSPTRSEPVATIPLETAPRDDARRSSPASPAQPPTTHQAPSPAVATRPRSAFTTVQQGETLEDVAIRVYGSSDQVDLLWRANRDLLRQKDSPLHAGAVLRTPEE